jgi:hypothetical protein
VWILFLHLVEIVVELGKSLLESLALSRLHDDLVGAGFAVKGISGKNLPVIEYALREGLSSGVGTEIGSESERLIYRQVGLDDEHGCSGHLRLFDDVTTTSVEYTVNSTDSVFGTLNLYEIDGLHETGLTGQETGVQATTSSGNDLATTTMDGIGVKGHVVDVESNATHVLVAENGLLGSPLEASNNGILDFIEVLNSLGDIDQEIGSSALGTEGPDLSCLGGVPLVLLDEDTGTSLEVVTGVDISPVDVVRKTLSHGRGLHEETIVFVGRL